MDCFGVIDFETEKATVFVPKLNHFYKIWMTTMDTTEFAKRYDLIDEFKYTEEMEEFFKTMNPKTVFLNKGINSDSGLPTLVPDTMMIERVCPNTKIDTEVMHTILSESRVIKNDEEV